jgi:hypothetical protein
MTIHTAFEHVQREIKTKERKVKALRKHSRALRRQTDLRRHEEAALRRHEEALIKRELRIAKLLEEEALALRMVLEVAQNHTEVLGFTAEEIS